jgi:hypothetical protein
MVGIALPSNAAAVSGNVTSIGPPRAGVIPVLVTSSTDVTAPAVWRISERRRTKKESYRLLGTAAGQPIQLFEQPQGIFDLRAGPRIKPVAIQLLTGTPTVFFLDLSPGNVTLKQGRHYRAEANHFRFDFVLQSGTPPALFPAAADGLTSCSSSEGSGLVLTINEWQTVDPFCGQPGLWARITGQQARYAYRPG